MQFLSENTFLLPNFSEVLKISAEFKNLTYNFCSWLEQVTFPEVSISLS